MKKLKLSMFAMLFLSLFAMTSCNLSSDDSEYWSTFGVITAVNTVSETMTLYDDSGRTVILSEASGLSTEYVGLKATITFTVDDGTTSDEFVAGTTLYGTNYSISIYPTQDIVIESNTDDEALMYDAYGSNQVSPQDVWLGGTHLNMQYQIGYSNTDISRNIELIVDIDKSTSTSLYTKLYYKTLDGDGEYSFSNVYEGIICFDLESSGDFVFENIEEVIVVGGSATAGDEEILTVYNDGVVVSQ